MFFFYYKCSFGNLKKMLKKIWRNPFKVLGYFPIYGYFPKDGFTLSWKMPWTQMDDEKNFPPNHNTSLNMKKKKEEALWY